MQQIEEVDNFVLEEEQQTQQADKENSCVVANVEGLVEPTIFPIEVCNCNRVYSSQIYPIWAAVEQLSRMLPECLIDVCLIVA